ncbi:MAG: hypothetical protein ABJC66_17500 [Gammaproteobacteria bacterium]
MPDSNTFAEKFIQLLNETKFPFALSSQDTLQQAHAVIYALLTRMLAQIGAGMSVADLASQGKSGGGPPHHDLGYIVHYLIGVGPDTMTNSNKLSAGLLPLLRD